MEVESLHVPPGNMLNVELETLKVSLQNLNRVIKNVEKMDF